MCLKAHHSRHARQGLEGQGQSQQKCPWAVLDDSIHGRQHQSCTPIRRSARDVSVPIRHITARWCVIISDDWRRHTTCNIHYRYKDRWKQQCRLQLLTVDYNLLTPSTISSAVAKQVIFMHRFPSSPSIVHLSTRLCIIMVVRIDTFNSVTFEAFNAHNFCQLFSFIQEFTRERLYHFMQL